MDRNEISTIFSPDTTITSDKIAPSTSEQLEKLEQRVTAMEITYINEIMLAARPGDTLFIRMKEYDEYTMSQLRTISEFTGIYIVMLTDEIEIVNIF